MALGIVERLAMLPVGRWFPLSGRFARVGGRNLSAYPDDLWARRDRVSWSTSGRFSPRSCSCIRTGFIHRHRSDPRRPHLPAARCHPRTIGNDLSPVDGTANEFSFDARSRRVEAAMRKERLFADRSTNVSIDSKSAHSFSVSVREKCARRGHCWTAQAQRLPPRSARRNRYRDRRPNASSCN